MCALSARPTPKVCHPIALTSSSKNRSSIPTRQGYTDQMTKPQSCLVRMLIFVATVCAAGLFLLSPLRDAFLANKGLNSVILGVLLIGILHMFRLVLMLRPEVV